MEFNKYFPQPKNWFKSKIVYSGMGKAEFSNPHGFIIGHTRIKIDQRGVIEAVLNINMDRFTSDVPLRMGVDEFLSGIRVNPDRPTIPYPNPGNPCIHFSVKTRYGTFTAKERIFHDGNRLSMPEKKTISFFISCGEYIQGKEKSGTFWVIPLVNFISDFVQCDHSLINHPLRLYSIPNMPLDIPDNQKPIIESIISSKRLIIFQYKDSISFIEPLNDYKIKKEKLQHQKYQALITSIMVGNLCGDYVEYHNYEKWFTKDLVEILSFASGSEVGMPWLEIRDGDGSILRRIHYRIPIRAFSQAGAPIIEGINRGTGKLLERALSSEYLGTSFLRVIIRHLVASTRPGISVEDGLTHIFKAFEILCKKHKTNKQFLADDLPEELKIKVMAVLKSTGKSLKDIFDCFPADSGIQFVRDRIFGKLSNVTNTDADFGSSIQKLLGLLGLEDAISLDRQFHATGGWRGFSSWTKMLTILRNNIIHDGYLDFRNEEYDIHDILSVKYHLLDLLVRIIFILVDYDKEYNPLIRNIFITSVPIHWVNSTKLMSEFGYK